MCQSDTPSFGLFLAPDHVHERHDVGGIHFPIVVQVGVGQLVLAAAHHYTHEHLRVGVVDERWEIAASERGRSQFDLGPHSDVLSGIPKAQAAMMLLRTMNPQIIAMDEITQPEDLNAIREIVGCGVRLIATAHASGPEELCRRPLYRAMLEEKLFQSCVLIRLHDRERRYELQRLPD